MNSTPNQVDYSKTPSISPICSRKIKFRSHIRKVVTASCWAASADLSPRSPTMKFCHMEDCLSQFTIFTFGLIVFQRNNQFTNFTSLLHDFGSWLFQNKIAVYKFQLKMLDFRSFLGPTFSSIPAPQPVFRSTLLRVWISDLCSLLGSRLGLLLSTCLVTSSHKSVNLMTSFGAQKLQQKLSKKRKSVGRIPRKWEKKSADLMWFDHHFPNMMVFQVGTNTTRFIKMDKNGRIRANFWRNPSETPPKMPSRSIFRVFYGLLHPVLGVLLGASAWFFPEGLEVFVSPYMLYGPGYNKDFWLRNVKLTSLNDGILIVGK